MDNTYRASLGEIAVDAHTDAIRNGQETEPLDTQALDTITNILHFLRQQQGPEFDRPFDPETLLRIALDNYESEI